MDHEAIPRGAAVFLDDPWLVVRFSSPPDTIDAVADILATIAQVEEGRVRPVLWDVRAWPRGRSATWIRLVSTVRQLFTAAALVHHRSARPTIEESPTTSRSAVPFGVFASEPEAQAFLYARTQPTGDDSSALRDRPTVFETAAAAIWYGDGIVFVRDKGVAATVETAAESLAVIAQLVGDHPRPLLWDAGDWRGFAPRVWLRVITAIESLTTSVAMVVSAERPESVSPFPELINDLLVSVQVFTDRDEALGYLRGQMHPQSSDQG